MIKSLYPKFQTWSATGSIWIISDTHFDDKDCLLMDTSWITPQEHINRLKKKIFKTDTLIHLGDVGEPSYLDELKCYKVLISGNHDNLLSVSSHFDEVYTGPLFIADRILLSHEPIHGVENICLNIHGHAHTGANTIYNEELGYITHVNLASNVIGYCPINLNSLIKLGYLSKIQNYHRRTIDNATEHKYRRESV